MPIAVNQVYRQDCLRGMRSLEDGCVQLAFADPPFNIGYEYDVYEDRKPRDRYLDWTRDWIAEVTRVLTPTGTFWLAIGDEYAAEAKLIAQSLGLTCRSWVVWYYTFGVHCKRKFTRSHTHLFHFVRHPKRFTFNASAIRVPSARQLVYADRRADPRGRMPDDTWMLPPSIWTYRPQDLSDSFRSDDDTWYFPRVCGTFRQRVGWHGCQMPEQLLARIIRVSSNEGDLVLDPFGGSGTTYAVAKKLGRRWLGFELSPQYVCRIRERLERTRPGDLLEGGDDPLATAPPTTRGRRLREGQVTAGQRNGRWAGIQTLRNNGPGQ